MEKVDIPVLVRPDVRSFFKSGVNSRKSWPDGYCQTATRQPERSLQLTRNLQESNPAHRLRSTEEAWAREGPVPKRYPETSIPTWTDLVQHSIRDQIQCRKTFIEQI